MLWRPYPFIIVIITALILSLVFVSVRYQTVKQKYQTLKQQYHAKIEAVKLQQKKLEALHQLDIQQTEKLNNAKAELDKLHYTVRSGSKWLRVSAVCRTSKTSTSKSGYDEATPQLSTSAREDYLRLRAMIVENEKQTEYLQKYIKIQFKS